MKKIYLLATAIVALASCTSDTFVGSEEEARLANGETPISFGFDVPAATRADNVGATAAASLGNQFIVYGEKSETTAAPSAGNYVFPNYQVNYAANTAYTSTSNTKDWEYVGYTHSANYQTNITTKDGESAAANALAVAQTIKFWDYSATSYTFTAVSAQGSDIEGGKVKIQKNTSGATVYDKGYKLTLTADADPSKIYIADRNVISPTTGTDRTAPNAYGGNVTLRFRNLLSQVRVGMYETIPGHTVTIKKFYYVNDGAPTFLTMSTGGTDKFYANVPNVATTSAATLTVTYYESGTGAENQPKVAVSGATTNNYIALGGADDAHTGLKENAVLATTAATPTYNETTGAYTSVFPQESNNKTLKLKVDYTLTADGTGETINVTGATAEIPAEYLQWKPNFKYTYLFKISENTNGSSGHGVVGLYPITFDAVEVIAEDGQAEYITTVSEPSITTFGVKGGKYSVGKNEYEAGSDIYATFMEGSAVKAPTLGTSGAQHVNVFAVTTSDATNFPITEASVAEAIANPAMSVDIYTYDGSSTYTKVTDATTITAGTTYYKADGSSKAPGDDGYTPTEAVAGTDYKVGAKLNVININSDASTYFTAVPAAVTTVPGEDGVEITENALKLTGVKLVSGVSYAIEYEASDAWTGTYKKVYKVIKVVATP